MNHQISDNTKAILLLTAPLILGRSKPNLELLKPKEYQRLARLLWEAKLQPSDLLQSDASEYLTLCQAVVDKERLERLLARGFLLGQVLERWQTRSIWVISRADASYPSRFKSRLRDESPALLYGCGDINLVDEGGLAVVGSRNVDDVLFSYTSKIGQLSAKAGRTIISGGAKGIDQAAMKGALESGGNAVGILAEDLEKVSINREERNFILDGKLVLISAYDPASRFNVGHAMQRNKLIYALADTSLVVNSDINKGGTWAGAIEQLNKFKFTPLFVRVTGEASSGLEALRKNGALPWPEPNSVDEFEMVFNSKNIINTKTPSQMDFLSSSEICTYSQNSMVKESISLKETFNEDPETDIGRIVTQEGDTEYKTSKNYSSYISEKNNLLHEQEKSPDLKTSMADKLFIEAKKIIEQLLVKPMKDDEVATALNITQPQARKWLERLVGSDTLKKDEETGYYIVNHN
ncbi:DNA-processing protein DprA [Rouxiella badensis]|uniref:DNA-processing protein DprA n=1 Tax=Rouxiella badensis TaxID=1646377 RepID=UPI0013EF4E44|nr:DNA-processing protein DprA [Rouxiella badensis]QII38251.1 DNA-processing protein DprA [Rouxiella badensis]